MTKKVFEDKSINIEEERRINNAKEGINDCDQVDEVALKMMDNVSKEIKILMTI